MILLSFCADCTWELLPMLFGAWLLGWLLWSWVVGRKYKSQLKAQKAALSELKANYTGLKKDFSEAIHQKENIAQDFRAHKSKYNELLLRLNAYEEGQAQLTTTKPLSDQEVKGNNMEEEPLDMTGGFLIDSIPASDPAVPEQRINFAAAFQTHQLQIVEGVGPKIETLLKAADIQSWEELAATPVERLQNILQTAGARYRMHDPSTWPKQANLAQNGDWAALVALQKSMSGGKNLGKAPASNQAKIEKMAAKALGITLYEPDDLKLVEGIGPKIEALLKAAGIKNWKDLSEAKLDFLRQVLRQAGDRYRLADPATWARQARLAVEGKWKELETYQDYLQGGKG